MRQNSDENKISTVVSSDRNTTRIIRNEIILRANEFQTVPRISRNSHPRRMEHISPNISLVRFRARRFEEGRKNSRKVKFFNKSESRREKGQVSSTRQTGNKTALTRVLGEICVEETKKYTDEK